MCISKLRTWLALTALVSITVSSKKIISRSTLDKWEQQFLITQRELTTEFVTTDTILAKDNTGNCRNIIGCESEYYYGQVFFRLKHVNGYIQSFKRYMALPDKEFVLSMEEYFKFCQGFEVKTGRAREKLVRGGYISNAGYKRCMKEVASRGLDRFTDGDPSLVYKDAMKFFKYYKTKTCNSKAICNRMKWFSKFNLEDFTELRVISNVVMAGAIINENDIDNNLVVGIYKDLGDKITKN